MKPSEREAFRLIEEMLQLMEARGLVELEMEHQGLRLRLKKASSNPTPHVVEYVTGTPQASPSPAGTTSSGTPTAFDDRRVVIKSPMVGTFYRAPAPDAPPYVEIGQDLEVGQVVCVIEAMKLMNEIKAETAGRVADILVENGSPVEFGQPLFVIEPPV
ncbi:MAG: acetyl-CoA carboxylase biotin carboxyl carrier protein [Candidatus Omnitrophica bacterium]|nr:acetyl-CoA carboxylase biotin carboxyl carrier protein [Candidatus Omnitrophota bacterium]MBI2173835.1 acetyl-CoA carboxylase biotin carboxyl carrier protein [Candidatus Omnitrophota bacterium]MBI3010518.1 acetyl-CoA carboxylase biotin carboxyl carrier protein [Candidatus Omnitrophota bacterium]